MNADSQQRDGARFAGAATFPVLICVRMSACICIFAGVLGEHNLPAARAPVSCADVPGQCRDAHDAPASPDIRRSYSSRSLMAACMRHTQSLEFHGGISACAGPNGLAAAILGRDRWARAAAWAGTEARALAGKPIAGTCPVCGTRRVLFRDFTANLRESGACSQCGASNRQRQMAYVLRSELRLPSVGRLTLPDRCRLYSAEANGSLHAALADTPGYVCSEYCGEAHASGASVNGIRHEDLEALSFGDSTIDVVLTSDVLEHVADAYSAHGGDLSGASIRRSPHLHGAVRGHRRR